MTALKRTPTLFLAVDILSESSEYLSAYLPGPNRFFLCVFKNTIRIPYFLKESLLGSRDDQKLPNPIGERSIAICYKQNIGFTLIQ